MIWLMSGALSMSAACGDDKGSSDKASKDTPGDSASMGLNHPDNDAAIVKLAKAATECKWQGSGLKSDCDALKKWHKAKELKDGAGDDTLLNMLEDSRKEVRWLACEGLDSHSNTWRKDKKKSQRVLAAAKAEQEKDVAYRVGRLVGKIDAESTGKGDAIKKLLAESKSTNLRKGIVGSVLFNNKGFYDVLHKMARSEKNKDVRKASAAAFWTGGSKQAERTCKLWLELADDDNGDLAGHSAYHCAFWSSKGGCTGQWDALLDVIDKRAKAGTVESSMMSASLGYLYKQKKATAAQKARAIKVAEAIIKNAKNNKTARGDALRVIGDSDPAKGKTLATKYKNDKEFFVKNAAKRILEGKK